MSNYKILVVDALSGRYSPSITCALEKTLIEFDNKLEANIAYDQLVNSIECMNTPDNAYFTLSRTVTKMF